MHVSQHDTSQERSVDAYGIILPESFLNSRNYRIHEAGHYAVGTIMRLPMAVPEVFSDGSGGVCPIEWDKVTQRAAREVDALDEMELLPKAATDIAAMYLAGFAAEAIASKTPWNQIIGSQTKDFSCACEVLRLGGLEGDRARTHLQLAWLDALRILDECWRPVCDLAKMIPETNGTHRPPRFH